MEEVCERENLKAALRQVKANQGSPGVDGMTVGGITDYLKQHWPTIRERLLNGTYEPQPVRRVEIPKPDGGVRKLGIPGPLFRTPGQSRTLAQKPLSARLWNKTCHKTAFQRATETPKSLKGMVPLGDDFRTFLGEFVTKRDTSWRPR